MSSPLICSFDRFEDAEQARALLLAAGLPLGSVALRVIEDEAGPVEGNFVSGNGHRDGSSPPDGVITGGATPYERNFARTVSRGVCLLMVEADDEVLRQRAGAVLGRYTARQVAAIARPADSHKGYS